MWKKSDHEDDLAQHRPAIEQRPPAPSRSREPATIGPSISIRGDLSGDEDLIVQGRVEGTINLKQNNVTVGKEGRITAAIRAQGITVEGHVEGNLHGDEQVVVRRSGNVQGDINTPRVTLEDGCRFKGAVDMELKPADGHGLSATNVAGLKGAGMLGEGGRSIAPSGEVDQKASGK